MKPKPFSPVHSARKFSVGRFRFRFRFRFRTTDPARRFVKRGTVHAWDTKSFEGNGGRWKERCQGRVRRGRGRGHRRERRRRGRPNASPTAAEREWRDVAPMTRLESNAGTRSRRDRLARSAAAKKRSRRPSLRRVKISERRDAAASGESGGRWSGAWCAAVARASRVSIDTTSARSPIDRDASRGPRDGSAFGGKKTDLARSVGDRVETDHDAGDAPAVLGVTSARRVISMRPAGSPPMVMSKKHTGLAMVS